MDSFVYSLNATIPIFLVMVLGGVIKKLGVIDDNFAKKANKYVFNVALPVMLFKDIASADMTSQFDLKFVLYCMLVTIFMFSAIWVLTEIFMKDDTMKGSFVQGSCRSSAAILGMAFIQNMYSDTGMAPLMIVAAVPFFNIISVIVLTFKAHPEKNEQYIGEKSIVNMHGTVNENIGPVKDDRGDKSVIKNKNNSDKMKNIKKACINILKNPIIIGIFLGLPFSLLHVTFPIFVQKTINSIAQTATPVALIVIGASFEGRKAIKKIKPTIIATFIKLIGLGAVFMPLAVWLGFRCQELMAILIMLASPTTVSSYIMAENMDNDGVLASSIIVLTTVLSSVTLTVWIFILRYFGWV